MKKLKVILAVVLSVTMVFSAAGVSMSAMQGAGGLNSAAQQETNSGAAGVAAKGSSFKEVESVDEAAEAISAATAAKKANADPEADCDCGYCPTIIVPGINHSPTYLYDENDNPVYDSNGKPIGGPLMIFDQDALIQELLTKLAVPLVKMLITQKDNGFTAAVSEFAKTAFSVQQCNDEGVPINNLKTEKFMCSLAEIREADVSKAEWVYRMVPMQKITSIIGEDHTYFFTFNLVGNAMDSAADLQDYVEFVKEETGHTKVNLVNVSLGGSIFTAYIDSQGWKDLDNVVNVVGAMDGTDMVADLFDRNFILTNEFVYHDLLPKIFEESEGRGTLGYLLNLVIRIIPRQVFEDTLSRAIEGIIETFMLNAPQFWAMIPKDRFESIAEKYNIAEEKPVLYEKILRYHEAQLRLEENVLAAVEDGVAINNILGANLAFGDVEYSYFSIMASSLTKSSDGIIQVESAGMGVTGAAPGTTLGVTPKAGEYSYVSPDGKVDVSTAVLPDNTWVFLNQHHEVGRNHVVLNLCTELVVNPELVNVHSMPEVWPQFNGSSRTVDIGRNYLPASYTALEEIEMTADQEARLRAAIAEGEAVINGSIANADRTAACISEFKSILVELGVREPDTEPTAIGNFLETLMKVLSGAVLKYYGARGWSDRINNWK